MKNKSFFIFCCSLLLLVAVSYSQTVNFPYPMKKNYGNGTINATDGNASDDLKAKFQSFLTQFYVTGTCGSNPCARIKFGAPGDPTETVSEGIGYGMIMMVYFSDKTTSYKDHFDRLWRYYKQFSNSNGIMNWKIKHGGTGTFSDGSVSGSGGGATDAEYDAALALIMAYYQWGGDSYLSDARTLIGNIWSKEHNTSTGLHYPGDQWQSDYNPSYVAPAAYELFKSYGTSANWTLALSANYTFLKNNHNRPASESPTNSTTGLPSGWAESNGKPKVCGNGCGINTIAYDQDAVRAPWRWATANAWFNHEDAKTLLTKLASWVSTKNAVDVKGPIQLNGTMGSNGNSSYVGSLACALTHSSTYQAKLNEYWNVLNGMENEPYFNEALRILTGLLITGNMPNLMACASSSGCGTNMSGGGYDGTSTPIDKFASTTASQSEDDRSLAATYEAWYAYTDKGSDGSSTISQNTKFNALDENDNCKEIESYRVVMLDGSEYVAKIPTYTLVKGSNEYAPYVALGLNARNNGTGTGKTYNFANCTGGFSYQYKGQGHNFKVQTTDVPSTSGADYFVAVSTSTTSWTKREVALTALAQPTWASAAQKVDFKPANIYAFAWELKGTDAGAAGISELTGNLAIKDFRCLGNLTLPSSKPASKCGGSSSSGGSGQSSSGTSGTSSSSGTSAGSSSSGGSSNGLVCALTNSSSVGKVGEAIATNLFTVTCNGTSVSTITWQQNRTPTEPGNFSFTASRAANAGSCPGMTATCTIPVTMDGTPILLSPFVSSNALIAMQNAVNIQATGKATVQIFDLKGNAVRTLKFAQGSYIAQMADLPKGVYLVKASSGAWKQTITMPVK